MIAIRVFGWIVALAFVGVGGPFLITLTIAVVWSGSAPHNAPMALLGYAAYVAGGTTAALWVAWHPTKVGAIALVVLLLPAAASFARSAAHGRSLAEQARTAVHGPDAETRRQAAATLLRIGRRAGRQPHLTELLAVLRAAPDDESRERAVVLLGALAYENAPILEELRALELETRGDAARGRLHAAVVDALGEIDPYRDQPTATGAS